MSDWIENGESGLSIRNKLNSLKDTVDILTGSTSGTGSSGTSGSNGTSGISGSSGLSITSNWYSYKAYITQSGTSVPTETILNEEDTNFLSGLTWSRVTGGTYRITKTGVFLSNQVIPMSEAYTDIDGNYYTITRIDDDNMELKTYSYLNTNILSDNILNSRYINIEIKL